MIVPTFHGTVSKGRLVYDEPERRLVWLAKLEGKRFEESVRRERSQRSIRQNSAYWGIAVEILSDHTGFDKDTMHEALKHKFLSRIDEKTGLTIIGSTRKMSTVEFNEYYAAIQRWAMEFLSVYIPDPNEIDYEQT
ncbi:MAG: hypothetical protein U1E51_02700 [Candidatus Binatia bacterium]|nr:hypothetical protein [Candidatus Binatia bacterium]